jgi:hypothetical protein
VREPRRAVMIIMRRIFHDLGRGPAVRGRERLVPRGEDVRVRLGARVRGDLGELALDAHAEAVEVEVVLVVLERVLDLLPDLEEAEEEERGERDRAARASAGARPMKVKGSSRDGVPAERLRLADEREREVEQVKPERHAQVRLVRERQRPAVPSARIHAVPPARTLTWSGCAAG